MADADAVPQGALDSTSMRIVSSVACMCFFLYLGHIIREKLAVMRWAMMPAALIGGLLALLFVQLCTLDDTVSAAVEYDWIVGWSQVPGFLINIIFTTLFMGSKIPSLKEAWRWAGPQLAYGQILAWGNWIVACGLTPILLMPVYDTNELFGSLFPVGFEGGHGTAAGLTDTYTELDFPEGGDLAITSATIGILSGVIFGTIICNIGDRYTWTFTSYRNTSRDEEQNSSSGDLPVVESESNASFTGSLGSKQADNAKSLKPLGEEAQTTSTTEFNIEDDTEDYDDGALPMLGRDWKSSAVIAVENRVPGSYLTISNDAIDTMALHMAFIGLALLAAYFTKRGLMVIDGFIDSEYSFLSGFPLFPIAMLWGLVVQVVVDKYTVISPLDRGMMERIGGISLDFLVLSAIATTKVEAVADNLLPLSILIVVGIAWQLLAFFFLGPLMLPDFWFERAIAELGKSFGTTATGIMLLRIVDPRSETPAMKAFSCKQLLHEPFMGGGIWTSLALPLIKSLGNWPVFGIAAAFIVFWFGMYLFLFRKMKLGPAVQYRFVAEYNPLS
ncbi:hypothetical protein SARC_10630 [Sphaeroforma arctica JP610]|uniref:Sodium/glutamate symporter n=1 Tax=Sphaeroforma arctica JP610 TaxID=667725 RepID=A0A0L0FJC3_9EUKA|nr:hypothetical protein SARC_10630 [Sphaeroforma arctica JP610]KNC76894.1 hypothetical protein SARC_10630 [Sphaeroforma arctica JP610]|eukprot:XP_014150796.1 hypothetical protein SARC_10630 [Sphaeroforma arctica JP610]